MPIHFCGYDSFFFFFAALQVLWALSSPIRDWTLVLIKESRVLYVIAQWKRSLILIPWDSLFDVSLVVVYSPSCVRLLWPMDCSLLGSPVHGILQARILEWVAIPFSRKASQPRNRTQVSCIAGRLFTDWATWEANNCLQLENKLGKYLNGVRGIFGS